MRVWHGLLSVWVVSCGSSQTAPTTAPAPAAAPVAAAPAEPLAPGRSARVVNATILTNDCQSLGSPGAKLAEGAMYQLVEGCAAVPGGTAQFEATLQPGGHIEIAAAPGQPDVVPICILKHSLLHHVPLVKPCRLDVRIEESSVVMPAAAGAPPPAPPPAR
jgi:hypothetical protein